MTSNIGSDIIRENFSKIDDNNRFETIEKTQEMVFEMLKVSVRPEFLNRIDETIMFQPLTKLNVREIVELQLNQVKEILEKQNIKLTIATDAMDWLAKEGYNPEFGARPIKRVIQKRVLNQLSKQMLLGEVEANSHVVLDAFDDKIVFRQPIREEIAILN
jgi:ATP-dependent Clp protease ATP-binding subunit ClpB